MQNKPPENVEDQTVFTPLAPSISGPQSPLHAGKPVQPEHHQPLFYTQEDDLDLQLPPIDEQDEQGSLSSPFVLPFQNSAAMPTLATMNAQGAQGSMGPPPPVTTSTTRKRWGSFPLVKILLIGSVVFITVIGASLLVLAQSAPSPTPIQGSNKQTPGTIGGASSTTTSKPGQELPAKTQAPTGNSSPQAPARQEQATQGSNTSPSGSIPSGQLLSQIGWTQAGLNTGDALEALRTSNTFTDREMSFDYRVIGTSTHHSRTLTAATFLLTPGGQVRFTHNDVRMINNTLFARIHSEKLIQQVVNVQPSLALFQIVQIQGQQHTFAWVNVAFELLQSKIDPANGKRTENLEIDSATGQPLLHHMAVLLIRVSPQSQGEDAPMGGTGWLVDTYALDSTTLPDIATDPSL